MKKTAVIIVGHGSKQRGFQAAMEKVARKIRNQKKFSPVVCAYLEITHPFILEAIDECVRKGAREVIVLPYFLLTGIHVKVDIPEIIALAKKKYQRQTKISLAPYLGYDDKIVEVVKQRLRAAK